MIYCNTSESINMLKTVVLEAFSDTKLSTSTAATLKVRADLLPEGRGNTYNELTWKSRAKGSVLEVVCFLTLRTIQYSSRSQEMRTLPYLSPCEGVNVVRSFFRGDDHRVREKKREDDHRVRGFFRGDDHRVREKNREDDHRVRSFFRGHDQCVRMARPSKGSRTARCMVTLACEGGGPFAKIQRRIS